LTKAEIRANLSEEKAKVGPPPMSAAATLRLQIEQALESRFPAALSPSPRTIRDVAATGIEEVDRLLDGGLPIGAISEITGPSSSGRTTLTLKFVAQRTLEERVCVWVDVNDALDPESAAANGVNLKHLLWVRCCDDQARANSDEKPSESWQGPSQSSRQRTKPWTRLDQALRATDLLLQAGGFAVIVLDLGDTTPENGRRIPLATWFRFRQAADRTRCSLVVLGKTKYAQSSAALAVECAPLQPEVAGGTVLKGFRFEVQRGRERFTPINVSGRKPPVSSWSATSAWDAEKRA
jgi:hypothetical protein